MISAEETTRPAGTIHQGWRILEIIVLTSFAVSQPLLSLVGDNPTFLVVHGIGGWQVIAFGVGVILVPGAILALIVLLTDRFHPSVGRWVHLVVVGILFTLASGPPLLRALHIDGLVSVAVLAVTAASATLAFARFDEMFTLIRFAAVAPAVFLGLFLLETTTAALLAPQGAPAGRAEPNTTPPIVWLVFDQLPLPLLLDDRGQMHSERYPGFADLAEVATWYPNAVTVAAHTNLVIPSMLTGTYAHPDRPPISQAYPENIFGLLGEEYTIYAKESVSRLCPPEACGGDHTSATTTRQLVADTSVIAARLLLADGVADRLLPEINDRWAGFGTVEPGGAGGEERRVRGDDRWRFEEFVDELGTEDRAVLHYLHQEKPHEPLLMLPDGRVYDFCSCYYTTADGAWPEDEIMMEQRFQQYVMQTMYVDGQVSRLLARMEEIGLLEEAGLIVVSDHGASMLPGNVNRAESLEVLDDVFPVPMFIKYPGQISGRVDPTQASIIDIVPSLLDAVGSDYAESRFDGRSLLSESGSRSFQVITDDGLVDRPRPDASDSALIDMATRLLPVADDPFVFGPHGRLVGDRVQHHVSGASELTAELRLPGAVATVDLDAAYVPAHVIGELFGADSPTALAVAFNDTIAGVGSTYDRGLWRISLMGNPRYFTQGENFLTLYEITPDGLLEIRLEP